MQPRLRRLFRDRRAVLPQSVRKLALQLELAARKLAHGSGVRSHTLEIGKPALGQIAHDLPRLKTDFGIPLPRERAVYFRQPLGDAAQLDESPGEIEPQFGVHRTD